MLIAAKTMYTYTSTKTFTSAALDSGLHLKDILSYIVLNDRTKLRQRLEEGWMEKTSSNCEIECVDIDWKTRKLDSECYEECRNDIFVLKLHFKGRTDNYNILVNSDLTYSVNEYDVTDTALFEEIEPFLKLYIEEYLTVDEMEYIAHQQKWFREKPWKAIHGKTPEEAVEILASMGW